MQACVDGGHAAQHFFVRCGAASIPHCTNCLELWAFWAYPASRRNRYRVLTLPIRSSWEDADARQRRSGCDQEIRQPTPLQHGYKHICDARGPGRNGQEGRGVHRSGRQDRRRHNPSGADPDHLRTGEQGRAEHAAHPVPAPAHFILRRPDADGRAELPRTVDDRVRQGAGAFSRADEIGDRQVADGDDEDRRSDQGDRGAGAAQHRNVPERHAAVHAVPARQSAWRTGAARTGPQASRKNPTIFRS